MKASSITSGLSLSFVSVSRMTAFIRRALRRMRPDLAGASARYRKPPRPSQSPCSGASTHCTLRWSPHSRRRDRALVVRFRARLSRSTRRFTLLRRMAEGGILCGTPARRPTEVTSRPSRRRGPACTSRCGPCFGQVRNRQVGPDERGPRTFHPAQVMTMRNSANLSMSQKA